MSSSHLSRVELERIEVSEEVPGFWPTVFTVWELVLLSRRHDVRMTGIFDNDWETGDLVFIVSDCEDGREGTRVHLEAEADDGREPLRSDVFEPEIGRVVRFDGPYVPGKVRRAWAEVVR